MNKEGIFVRVTEGVALVSALVALGGDAAAKCEVPRSTVNQNSMPVDEKDPRLLPWGTKILNFNNHVMGSGNFLYDLRPTGPADMSRAVFTEFGSSEYMDEIPMNKLPFRGCMRLRSPKERRSVGPATEIYVPKMPDEKYTLHPSFHTTNSWKPEDKPNID